VYKRQDHTALSHFVKKGKVKEKNDDASSVEFLFAHNFIELNNFHHYEVSNYSLKNQESKHNSNYWNNTPYLGVGPSAHSYDGVSRQWNVANNILYLNAMKSEKIFFEKEVLSDNQNYNEYLVTRLRTAKGISLTEIETRFGKNVADELRNKISDYNEPTQFIFFNENLKLTPIGMLHLNSIVVEWMK
jgi:oxygen-independent coproporphyrinogen-3 oxidase